MGAAKQRKQQQGMALKAIAPASSKISSAIIKLANAASSHLGADCYIHAAIGRELLSDFGIESRIAIGFAAWRVGQGDGDVISHHPSQQNYGPAGVQAFPYHAWLESGDVLIDFTTYQLHKKAADLDAADGGSTTVAWCPEYLVLPRSGIRSYKDVAQLDAGLAYYEEVPGLNEQMASKFIFDPRDAEAARLILASPGVQVYGPMNL